MRKIPNVSKMSPNEIYQKKQYVEHFKKDNQRINFNGEVYFELLKENYFDYVEYKRRAEKLFNEVMANDNMTALEWNVQNQEFIFKMNHNGLITITFAAMFLECLIWDYAVINGISKKKLGGMGALKKWEVIPGLVNNKASIDGNAISLLKKLVLERNEIVHSKSKPVPSSYEKLMEHLNKERKITVSQTIQCVDGCIKGLREVDTTNYWFLQKDLATSYTIRKIF